MNSSWFIIGLIMVAVAFGWYMMADNQEYKAKNYFSASSIQKAHDAQQSKTAAMGLDEDFMKDGENHE